MDAEAIKRIEQLAAAGTTAHVDRPYLVVPEGANLESLEQFEDQPYRMRARFRTERITDFCRYVQEQAVQEGGAVFIHPRGKGAQAVIDYGSHDAPLWGNHRASLAPKHTAEYDSLLKAVSEPLTQRDITDWLEDWQSIITPYREGETLPVSQAIANLRRVDIKASLESQHQEDDWSSTKSSMEQIEAKSGKRKLPEGFRLEGKVFPDTESRDIDVRISLLTGDNKPRFRLRIVGREALEESIAREVEERVREGLGEAPVQIYVGEA